MVGVGVLVAVGVWVGVLVAVGETATVGVLVGRVVAVGVASGGAVVPCSVGVGNGVLASSIIVVATAIGVVLISGSAEQAASRQQDTQSPHISRFSMSIYQKCQVLLELMINDHPMFGGHVKQF